MLAGYNDELVLATAATSRCQGYHSGNRQRPAGVNNVCSGIGNDELASTITHVVNGNGNDVRVPWWDEHRRDVVEPGIRGTIMETDNNCLSRWYGRGIGNDVWAPRCS